MATAKKEGPTGQVASDKPVVWGGRITFHSGAANVAKPIPTVAELSAKIDAFLTTEYGYQVGVDLDRRDK